MLKFKVENQIIKRTDDFEVIADSRNYLTAEFEFSSEWTGDITAIFGHGDQFYHQTLKDGTCTVPWEVIKTPYFTVSVFCGDLVTANMLYIRVGKSGFADGEVPGTPTPTIWQEYIDELAAKNQEIADNMETEVSANVLQSAKTHANSVAATAQSNAIAQAETLAQSAQSAAINYANEELAKKADIEDVPTKLSELSDDVGYAKSAETERIKYYGDPNIVPTDASYFTVNETGETITGLTDTGKTQTELVIPYKINGVEITTLFSGITTVSVLGGAQNTIKKVTIPNSVTNIGDGAFWYCAALTSINIPNSITSIGESAFTSCTALTHIEIPNSVTNIGAWLFSGCTALTSVNIYTTSISVGAFGACTALTSINIPNTVTSILPVAFDSCTALTSVYIPNSVTSIDGSAFTLCENLTIYCEQGSYAETYANDNNIPVVYTDVSATELDNKADKATTLSGYGITDAYTKTEVEAYINETILGGAW